MLRRVVAAATLVLLSGCLAPAGAGGENGSASTTAVPARAEPVTMEGCDVVEAITVVPAERVRGLVPEGLAALEGPEGVRVVLGGHACGGQDGRAFLAVAVEPTDERLRDARVSRYFYHVEHDLAHGEPLTALFEELGADARIVDAVQLRANAVGAVLEVVHEDAMHRVDASGPRAPGTGVDVPGVFREYARGHGGFVYLDAAFATPPGGSIGIGHARIATAENTVAREVLGAEVPAAAAYVMTGATYAEARVGFVPFGAPLG